MGEFTVITCTVRVLFKSESRKPGRETKVVINEHTGGCSSDCEGSVGLLSPVVSCEGAVSSECSECVCSSAGKEGLPAICESTW